MNHLDRTPVVPAVPAWLSPSAPGKPAASADPPELGDRHQPPGVPRERYRARPQPLRLPAQSPPGSELVSGAGPLRGAGVPSALQSAATSAGGPRRLALPGTAVSPPQPAAPPQCGQPSGGRRAQPGGEDPVSRCWHLGAGDAARRMLCWWLVSSVRPACRAAARQPSAGCPPRRRDGATTRCAGQVVVLRSGRPSRYDHQTSPALSRASHASCRSSPAVTQPGPARR
jgi:hypothetical protein